MFIISLLSYLIVFLNLITMQKMGWKSVKIIKTTLQIFHD